MRFKKTDPRAITPTRNNTKDAGLDLYALEDVVIYPGEVVKIRTGIHVALEEGETGLFWGKSGRAWNMRDDKPVGLAILGGCIDGPYRGELIVVAANINTNAVLEYLLFHADKKVATDVYNAMAITVPYGKAITQMLVVETNFPAPIEVSAEEFDGEVTERGEKGFGSSDSPTGGSSLDFKNGSRIHFHPTSGDNVRCLVDDPMMMSVISVDENGDMVHDLVERTKRRSCDRGRDGKSSDVPDVSVFAGTVSGECDRVENYKPGLCDPGVIGKVIDGCDCKTTNAAVFSFPRYFSFSHDEFEHACFWIEAFAIRLRLLEDHVDSYGAFRVCHFYHNGNLYKWSGRALDSRRIMTIERALDKPEGVNAFSLNMMAAQAVRQNLAAKSSRLTPEAVKETLDWVLGGLTAENGYTACCEDIHRDPSRYSFNFRDFKTVFGWIEKAAQKYDAIVERRNSRFPESDCFFIYEGDIYNWNLIIGQGSIMTLTNLSYGNGHPKNVVFFSLNVEDVVEAAASPGVGF